MQEQRPGICAHHTPEKPRWIRVLLGSRLPLLCKKFPFAGVLSAEESRKIRIRAVASALPKL